MVGEKQFIDNILKRLKNGGLTVTYWDGDTQSYGPAKPYAHITVKDPKALRAILKNVNLGFGESYSEGLIEIEGPLGGPIRFVTENSDTFSKISKLRLPKLHKNTRHKQQDYIAHHY